MLAAQYTKSKCTFYIFYLMIKLCIQLCHVQHGHVTIGLTLQWLKGTVFVTLNFYYASNWHTYQ